MPHDHVPMLKIIIYASLAIVQLPDVAAACAGYTMLRVINSEFIICEGY